MEHPTAPAQPRFNLVPGRTSASFLRGFHKLCFCTLHPLIDDSFFWTLPVSAGLYPSPLKVAPPSQCPGQQHQRPTNVPKFSLGLNARWVGPVLLLGVGGGARSPGQPGAGAEWTPPWGRRAAVRSGSSSTAPPPAGTGRRTPHLNVWSVSFINPKCQVSRFQTFGGGGVKPLRWLYVWAEKSNSLDQNCAQLILGMGLGSGSTGQKLAPFREKVRLEVRSLFRIFLGHTSDRI